MEKEPGREGKDVHHELGSYLALSIKVDLLTWDRCDHKHSCLTLAKRPPLLKVRIEPRRRLEIALRMLMQPDAMTLATK